MTWRAFVICSTLAAVIWIAAVAVTLVYAAQPWRCADYDRDGTVSVEEIWQVVDHFGTYPSQQHPSAPRWDPRYDLKRDQRVDLSDIIIAVRQHFLGCEEAQP